MPTINHFDYFTDIEQAFIRRRGKHLMIGPLDWALIDSWEKRKIPLNVVIQAIDEVFRSFEQRNKDKTAVRSLKYCSDAVERRFADWSRSHVGKPDTLEDVVEDQGFTEADIKDHIEKCLKSFQIPKELPESIQKGLANVRRELLSIQPVAGSELDLERLDDEIDSVILAAKRPWLEAPLTKVIEKKLAGYGISGNGAASERVVCETVRDKYGIPRLSLFKL